MPPNEDEGTCAGGRRCRRRRHGRPGRLRPALHRRTSRSSSRCWTKHPHARLPRAHVQVPAMYARWSGRPAPGWPAARRRMMPASIRCSSTSPSSRWAAFMADLRALSTIFAPIGEGRGSGGADALHQAIMRAICGRDAAQPVNAAPSCCWRRARCLAAPAPRISRPSVILALFGAGSIPVGLCLMQQPALLRRTHDPAGPHRPPARQAVRHRPAVVLAPVGDIGRDAAAAASPRSRRRYKRSAPC